MSEPTPDQAVGWWTLSTAAAAWPDSNGGPEDVEQLRRHLAVAHEQCLEYRPLVRDEASDTWVRWTPELEAPERFRQAQLLQAKASWQAERAGVGDLIGPDGRSVRVYPLDAQVKALLRPDDGTPVIG